MGKLDFFELQHPRKPKTAQDLACFDLEPKTGHPVIDSMVDSDRTWTFDECNAIDWWMIQETQNEFDEQHEIMMKGLDLHYYCDECLCPNCTKMSALDGDFSDRSPMAEFKLTGYKPFA